MLRRTADAGVGQALLRGGPPLSRCRSANSRRPQFGRGCSAVHRPAVLRAGNVALMLSLSLGTSAHVLTVLGEANEALSRLREGEQLLARNAARGHVAVLGWVYWRLGQAALVLGRLDEARRLGECAVQ